jgi:hypothetical protein
LQICVKVDFDNTVSNCVSVFLLTRARTAVENEEYRLVFFCAILLLDICLMLAEKFGMELDVTRLVDTMDVTKASSNAEVGRDLGEGGPDVVDIFWLGIERVVVHVLVIDTVFFAASDTDFLSNQMNPGT